MPEQVCPSCNEPFSQHLGLLDTCEWLQESRSLARKFNGDLLDSQRTTIAAIDLLKRVAYEGNTPDVNRCINDFLDMEIGPEWEELKRKLHERSEQGPGPVKKTRRRR